MIPAATLPRPPADAAALLAAVAAAGLLPPARLKRAAAAVPAGAAVGAAADALIAAGHLTRFQADRLLAGRTDGFVLDPYVIQEPVGKGADGRVYRAVHTAMNRPVALKLFRPDLARVPDAADVFDREVRSAAKLNHPNVSTTLDAGTVGDKFYLVTEFVDGPTAADVVRDRGPLPVGEACELVRQAAVGLGHAHELGVIHRDVKPTNLLVTRPSKALPGCVVKVAEFGLARVRPAGADADFAAPERAVDPTAADHRADLYGLGAVLYFLLTGRPPGEWPQPVGSARPDVPAAVAEVVHRLLDKDPNARFQSAAGLASRLDNVAAGAVEVEHEDDGAFITFDLPAVPPAVYAPSTDGLTGTLHRPGDTDTCPWAGLTADNTPRPADPTPPPVIEVTPEPPPARSLTGAIVAAAGLAVAAGAALAWALVR